MIHIHQRLLLFFLFFFSMVFGVRSQDLRSFQDFFEAGKAKYEVPEYDEAVKSFKAAKLLCGNADQCREVDEWLEKANEGLTNALRRELRLVRNVTAVLQMVRKDPTAALRDIEKLYILCRFLPMIKPS